MHISEFFFEIIAEFDILERLVRTDVVKSDTRPASIPIVSELFSNSAPLFEISVIIFRVMDSYKYTNTHFTVLFGQ